MPALASQHRRPLADARTPASAAFCRATLIVVGHVESLQTNPRWSALVSHARKQGCMYKAGAPAGGGVVVGR